MCWHTGRWRWMSKSGNCAHWKKSFSAVNSRSRVKKVSLRQFLDPEDYDLLDHLEQNLERIKDRITAGNPQLRGVNDMPYLVAIGRDIHMDLDYEYRGILDLYDNDRADGKSGPTPPVRAFFGEMTTRPPAAQILPAGAA